MEKQSLPKYKADRKLMYQEDCGTGGTTSGMLTKTK